MFLSQHAQQHTARMEGTQDWSFEDDIFHELNPEQARTILAGGEHPIAWSIWLIARIEDVTMNILVAGGEQVYTHENWLERMKLTVPSTGNLMGIVQVAELSQAIDIGALRAYRKAVGCQTRRFVRALSVEDIKYLKFLHNSPIGGFEIPQPGG